MSFIIANRLGKSYGQGKATVTALSEVSFQIESGEFIAIMGESGAGKSTLLSILGAMNAPSKGSLEVDDIDVYQLSQEKRTDFRREFLGFIFQSFHLISYLTVLENVMLPLAIVRKSAQKKQSMAMEALIKVGLENKADRLPSQISGGEKERVAIARAIVNDPPLLLADEPTGNLDSRNSQDIMKLLKELNDQHTTIMMVTHSQQCAANAQRVLQMSDGQLLNH